MSEARVGIESLEALDQFAKILANRLLNKQGVITLQGDLGAGKTALAKFIIHHITQLPVDDITSPTFNLLQTYDYQEKTVYHYDLYRLEDEMELTELGIEESMNSGICLIEWPEIACDYLLGDEHKIIIKVDHHTEKRSIICQSSDTDILKLISEFDDRQASNANIIREP